MKINERITTPDNYTIIKATHEEILDRVGLMHPMFRTRWVAKFQRKLRLRSLKRGGGIAKKWVEITRFMPHLLAGLEVQTAHNIVPSVLRNSLATLISGTNVTPTFKANYFALGSGSAAPSNADLILQTEEMRALFTNRSSYTNIAYLDVFFDASEVGGETFNEAGIFVDGSGSANTGYLLSRVSINQSLGAAQTLTVNCSITIS